ncbi:MAG: hypothetical protein KBD78_14625 [Oligoflexales bacterium]|nr:hypothetical protein [Oligoflexales bacterium]
MKSTNALFFRVLFVLLQVQTLVLIHDTTIFAMDDVGEVGGGKGKKTIPDYFFIPLIQPCIVNIQLKDDVVVSYTDEVEHELEKSGYIDWQGLLLQFPGIDMKRTFDIEDEEITSGYILTELGRFFQIYCDKETTDVFALADALRVNLHFEAVYVQSPPAPPP